MSNPHGAFIWYELLTSDPDGAQSFYGEVAGWTVQDSGQAGMDYRILNAPDASIGGLMKLPGEAQAGGMKPAWIGYIGVDDVDETVAKLTDAGGAVHMPAQDISGVGRIAMAADPDGAPFYVMRPTPPPDAPDSDSTAFNRTAPGHVAWNELSAKDHEKAFAFYAGLFGWTKGERMDMGDMGIYQMIDLVEKSFGAIMDGAPGKPAAWTFYITVDDIDAALERVKAAGGTVMHGPSEIPGGDFIILGADPQGAVFALVGPRKI